MCLKCACLYALKHLSSYTSTYTGGTVHITDMILYSVVGVSVLLAIMCLASGITFGVALWRRVRKRKGEPPQRQKEPPQRQGEPLEMIGTIQIGKTVDEEHSNDHTYEYVNDESSTEPLYQGLVARTQDYLSVYNQLNGETYQELDSQGREHEHHYQSANQVRERHVYNNIV